MKLNFFVTVQQCPIFAHLRPSHIAKVCYEVLTNGHTLKGRNRADWIVNPVRPTTKHERITAVCRFFHINGHGPPWLSNQEPPTTNNESLLRTLVRLSYNRHGRLGLSNQESSTTKNESLRRMLVRLSYKNNYEALMNSYRKRMIRTVASGKLNIFTRLNIFVNFAQFFLEKSTVYFFARGQESRITCLKDD